MINLEQIILLAKDQKQNFENLSDKIEYEDKGVLFSEMFFLFLCINQLKINRIIESGRARGQSTLMFAKLFPGKQIISIEHDPNSPDVDVAYQRLKEFNNVILKFGDAMAIVPDISQKGDVVFIDGPKGYKALRFALKLLSTGNFPLVFIHDTTKGTSERKFLEKYITSAIYSDSLPFARISHTLDDKKVCLPDELKIDGNRGYGFSLACIPYEKHVNYRVLLFKAVISGVMHKWFKI